MASAPCSANARAISTASSTSVPPSAPVGGRDADASSAGPPATPRGPRRRPRAGSAAGSPASRRTRRCGGWSAARGTTTAGSRARSAARAGRSPAAAAAPAAADELGAGSRPGRPRVSSRGTWLPAPVGQRRRADDLPVARPAAARRCPPTSAWSSPCGRSGRAGGRSSPRCCACTKSTIRAPGRLLLVGPEPGAARGDPALGRDADHLGHHQPGAAERLAAQVDEVEVAGHAVDGASTCPSARRRPGCASSSPPSRNGWNIGGAHLAGALAASANRASTAATNSGSRSRRLS